jgi:heme/copper-type cytochrome/quinol oxidase subunit 2
MTSETYTTRPISGLTTAVVVWVWISIVLLAISAVGSAAYLQSLFQVPSSEPMTAYDPIPGGEAILLLALLPQYLALIASLVLGFLVLRWCYRASRNTNAVARGVTTAPHWAIWWWFIPFASLFKPYAVLSEVWRVARDPDRWTSLKDPVRLRFWWGLHLAANFAGAIIDGLDRATDTAGEVVMLLGATVVLQVILMVGALLFIGIVRETGRGQTRLIAEGRTTAPSAEGPLWAP